MKQKFLGDGPGSDKSRAMWDALKTGTLIFVEPEAGLNEGLFTHSGQCDDQCVCGPEPFYDNESYYAVVIDKKTWYAESIGLCYEVELICNGERLWLPLAWCDVTVISG